MSIYYERELNNKQNKHKNETIQFCFLEFCSSQRRGKKQGLKVDKRREKQETQDVYISLRLQETTRKHTKATRKQEK